MQPMRVEDSSAHIKVAHLRTGYQTHLRTGNKTQGDRKETHRAQDGMCEDPTLGVEIRGTWREQGNMETGEGNRGEQGNGR